MRPPFFMGFKKKRRPKKEERVSLPFRKKREGRNKPEDWEWSRLVKTRDGWRCVDCGSVHKVVAHHIRPYALFPTLRYDIENGITLCKGCHLAAHRRIRQWGVP